MLKVTIVRHGETNWNAIGRLQGKKDIALNNIGREQAQECREALLDLDYHMIVSSSLKRAKQTARIIHHKSSAGFLEMGYFVERHFGDGEGLTKEERAEKFPNTTDYPNQESLEDFNKRIMTGLDYLVEHFDGKEIILVTHGAVINELLATLSNETLKRGEMGLVNGSISTIEYEDGKWSIINYNQHDHLTNYSDIGRI